MRKGLYMETTSIPWRRTIGEIIAELVRSGATSINTDYEAGKISGLRWIMQVNGESVLFDMPVRIEPVFKVLQGRRKRRADRKTETDREQAEQVAWRQLLKWVQAQNAMIETGMVQAAEVYLPYLVTNTRTGQTLFERMTESRFKMLEAAKG